MNAPTTRKPVVTTDVFGPILTLNFITGEELTVDVNALSVEIQQQAMLHGLKQKLVDAAAIARNTETGLTASPEDKFAAVKTVYDRIIRQDGTWNAIREGVEHKAGGLFMRALMELTGKTKPQLEVMVEKMSKEEVSALKKSEKVLAITQRMEREAAAQAGNTGDDLLAMLAGGTDAPNEATTTSSPAPKAKKGGK